MPPRQAPPATKTRTVARLLPVAGLALAALACNLPGSASPTPTPLPPTPTEAPTPTETATPEPTPTETSVPPTAAAGVEVSAYQAVNCRLGDSTAFDVDGTLPSGAVVPLNGVNPARTWALIQHPNKPARTCWIWLGAVQVSGDTAGLATLASPPTPVPGIIRGVVYHDMCAPPGPGGPTPAPDSGCVPVGGGGYRANGTLDVGEPGIPGVVVHLGSGGCPATISASQTTDGAGEFAFGGLFPGTYCIFVSASANAGALIPGGWTDPLTSGDVAGKTVSLLASQVKSGIYLGWDYQFAP